jgi:hypothetical protein
MATKAAGGSERAAIRWHREQDRVVGLAAGHEPRYDAFRRSVGYTGFPAHQQGKRTPCFRIWPQKRSLHRPAIERGLNKSLELSAIATH